MIDAHNISNGTKFEQQNKNYPLINHNNRPKQLIVDKIYLSSEQVALTIN